VQIKLEATGGPARQPCTGELTTEERRVTEAGAFLGTGGRTLTCNHNSAVLRPDAASVAVHDAAGRVVLTASREQAGLSSTGQDMSRP
jgi:hypothetical protein